MISGIVPDSFRILRQILDRIEDPVTGKIHEDFQVEMPEDKKKYAEDITKAIGWDTESIPFVEGAKPMSEDALENFMNNNWNPFLTVCGASGLPDSSVAGNVL